MSQDIEENIGKILKTQNCKKSIENKLFNKKLNIAKDSSNPDRMELNCMLFQVAKEGFVTDHIYFFPCVFELNDETKINKEENKERIPPKTGSYIRTIKMDFDTKNFNLVIYDYQHLGGAGSIAPSNAAKVNWNSQTISQVIRKNNMVKGGEILLDSYLNDKGPKQPFQYPKVEFLTVKGLQKIFSERQKMALELNMEKIKVPEEQDNALELNTEKIKVPKDEDNQSKDSQIQESKIRTQQDC